MHETNICSGLAVGSEEVASITEAMYNLQYKLQDRLGKLPLGTASLQDKAVSLIYWRHCIHTELDELLEWFEKEDPTDDFYKEMEMELVDVLHFVFNMAITTSIPIKEVASLTETGPWVVSETYDRENLNWAILYLSKALSDYIDLFPWKTWKTYKDFKFNEELVIKQFAVILMEVFNIAKLLGMTENRVYNVYVAKNKENHARQDRGY